MSSAFKIIKRGIATSCTCHGKRNFRKFMIINKRGPREFKEKQRTNPDPDIPINKRGVRDPGIVVNGKFMIIPEKIPELIVPDLTGFKLQPYVSYRSTDVVQSKFTARDLFTVVYADKIKKDFEENKLHPDGQPVEPSTFEKLTPQEAKHAAEKTGTDIFTSPKN